MALFLSTYQNKVDKKGRVSVPSLFRSALQGQNFHGVILYASHKSQCIEACGIDRMEQLSESLDDLDMFSDQQDDLAASIFADAHQVPIDGDGRIILPTDLAAHAGIENPGVAAFVGRGKTFQIWHEDTLAKHKDEARKRAKQEGVTLSLKKNTE